MIHWLKFIFLVTFLSCAPKKGHITMGPATFGATAPGVAVSFIQVTGTQLIIDGTDLQNTTTVVMESTTRSSFSKTFNVISATANQIIAEAVDATKIPVGIALNLILSNAYAQTSIPIEFELPPDSVSTPDLNDNVVTTPKLADKSVTLFKLADGPTTGTTTQVIAWNPQTGFYSYAPYVAASGGSGVTSIILGAGMVGQISPPMTGPVTVAVDTAVAGDTNPLLKKIPYFNNYNEIELNRNGFNPAKILFGNAAAPTEWFSLYNFGTEFRISLEDDSGGVDDLFLINNSGLVTIPGDLMVSGKNVCLEDGTSCPGVSVPVTQVLAAAPLTASGTGTITIGPGAVNTANNLIQLEPSGKFPASITGIVRGPASSSSGTLAYFLDSTGSQLADSNLNFQNIPTMAASASGTYQPILSGGNNKTLITASYTIPSTACAGGEILIADSSGNLECASYQGGVTLFNGRSGVVTPTAGDYSAVQITNVPFPGPIGNIDAMDVQAALDELATEKLALAGGSMTGAILMGATNEIRFGDLAGPEYVGFKAPNDILSNVIWTLPAAAGASGTILTTNGSNVLTWTSVGGAGGIGNVVGPGISTIGGVPSFANGTGNLLADSTKLVTNLVTNTATATAGNLAQFDSSGKVISDSGINVADVALMGPLPSGPNMPILSTGVSRTLIAANYELPVTVCSGGSAIISNGFDFICSPNAMGDVVSTGTPTINAIPIFSNTSGKSIQGSSFTIDGENLIGGYAVVGENPSLGAGMPCFSNSVNANSSNQYALCQGAFGNTILNSAVGQPLEINIGGVTQIEVSTALSTIKNSLAVEGTTIFNGPIAATNSSTFPTTRGSAGQLLSTNGAGVLSWTSVGIGVNSVSAATYTLAASDCGNTVTFSNAATLTVPVLSIGCSVDIVQIGTGQVTVSGNGTMIVQNAFNLFKTRSQYSLVTVKILTGTLAILAGDIN